MDNNPQHTTKEVVTNWLTTTKSMFWCGHYKSMTSILRRICRQIYKCTNIAVYTQLRYNSVVSDTTQLCQDKWVRTPADYCEKLMQGNPKYTVHRQCYQILMKCKLLIKKRLILIIWNHWYFLHYYGISQTVIILLILTKRFGLI